jgi:hypothetical protein
MVINSLNCLHWLSPDNIPSAVDSSASLFHDSRIGWSLIAQQRLSVPAFRGHATIFIIFVNTTLFQHVEFAVWGMFRFSTCFHVAILLCFFDPKMEAIYSFETTVDFQRTT